jgi:hypothetical protein
MKIFLCQNKLKKKKKEQKKSDQAFRREILVLITEKLRKDAKNESGGKGQV